MKAKKRELRRLERIEAWEKMMATKGGEYKQVQRMEAGGYRRPGSNKPR
jgi:hypothetical protein